MALAPYTASPEETQSNTIEGLIAAVSAYSSENPDLRKKDLNRVRQAYEFAARAHEGQFRKSGEPFTQHPLCTALLLSEIRMDTSTICAGLLHDCVEDTDVTLDDIRTQFGVDVALLVDGVTKLTQLDFLNLEDTQAENLRKMFLAMARDIRVVIVKLADRLHNMRTLAYVEPERQRRKAQETLDIYAPLANQLGMGHWKWQLEDAAFAVLHPDVYKQIESILAESSLTQDEVLQEAVQTLTRELEEAGIQGEVSGRPKHITSTWFKMQRKSVGIQEIYDLIGVRVVVSTVQQCYGALGLVHTLWKPIPGQFDDYISVPKSNNYRSLHTAVIGPRGQPVEVQLRSQHMHQEAELGVAAHWRYKEGERGANVDERLAWLRQLLTWQEELSSAREFVETVKADIFEDQVFVFTPRGDVKDLPAGSTPIDFAYRIHTDVGHRCLSAKVNGQIKPLYTELQNGDVVDIQVSKAPKGPSRDWINIVKSSHTRERIRQWFKKQERAENVTRGREMLDKEIRRLGQGDLSSVDEARVRTLCKSFTFNSADDLFAAIGYGAISTQQVVMNLSRSGEQPAQTAFEPETLPAEPRTDKTTGTVQVMGEGNMLTRLATCCKPLPGDHIVGYITRGRGVTVHRRDCRNVHSAKDKERLVPVDWGDQVISHETRNLPLQLAQCCGPQTSDKIKGYVVDGSVEVHRSDCRRVRQHGPPGMQVSVSWSRTSKQQSLYPVALRAECVDRPGLLRDISAVVTEEKLNISAANVNTDGGAATITFTVEVTGVGRLAGLMAKIERVGGVVGVQRDVRTDRPQQGN